MSKPHNLTEILRAKRDRYARAQGEFILASDVSVCDSERALWDWIRSLGGRQIRVIYRTLDGTVRDMVGRQGVHNSEQDGTVAGTGHAMASADRLTLSFWTATYGSKVNTGAGKGYRTLRAAGVLAVRCEGHDVLTGEGLRSLRG